MIGVVCDPCVCEHLWYKIIKGRCHLHNFIIEVDMATSLGERWFKIVEGGSHTWTTTQLRLRVILAHTVQIQVFQTLYNH